MYHSSGLDWVIQCIYLHQLVSRICFCNLHSWTQPYTGKCLIFRTRYFSLLLPSLFAGEFKTRRIEKIKQVYQLGKISSFTGVLVISRQGDTVCKSEKRQGDNNPVYSNVLRSYKFITTIKNIDLFLRKQQSNISTYQTFSLHWLNSRWPEWRLYNTLKF